MILSILITMITPVLKSGNSLQELLPLLLSAAFAGTGYLSRKQLRRVRWQLLKGSFTSFFKKGNNDRLSSLKFWLIVLGAFVLLWLLVSLLVAAIVVVAGLLAYAIIANKQPSY